MSSRESRDVARGSSHRRDQSRDKPPDLSGENTDDLRIVLLGRTGAGISSTGNTILGREVFRAERSSQSVTTECQRETAEINGRRVTVIDTPGLNNTELSNEEIQREISNCIPMILPGPHVFIIVFRVEQFTYEDERTAKIIKEMFGDKSLMYTMLLFTKGDYLDDITIEEFLGPRPHLMKLIEAYGNRYHVFNNRERDRTQVSELLQKIDDMVEENRGSFFLMFRQMEREDLEKHTEILMDRVREREEEMRKLEEERERMKMMMEKLNREREELMKKHEEERERMKMMMEEERQNHDKERKRREEEYREREERYKILIKEKEREIQEEMRREREEMRQEKEQIMTEKDFLKTQYEREIDRIENERRKREEEFNEKEERYKREMKEQMRDEMRRERETFKHDLEEMKHEKEKLQIKYDTEIDRIEKERKKREECINREEQIKREILEEMKREGEEWEKQRPEEQTRREEEKEEQTPGSGHTNSELK